MKYITTRTENAAGVESAVAIRNGLAPDGGLYLPESIPQLTGAEIKELQQSDYAALAAKVMSLFLTDYTYGELLAAAEAAYSAEKFGGVPAPISKVGEDYFSELWHGPTCAFKDMALQVMPRLLSLALDKTGAREDAHILVATSGDTGVAALEGYKNVPRTRITVFYPANGVSDTQKRQMSTQEGENADVVAVRGDFDAAQTGVKRIFASESAAKRAAEEGCFLSSANSINWGRLVPQIVYYVHACVRLRAEGELAEGEKLDIAVPTGNFGNILAAYIAKRMGMPIGRLICASNENNVLTDFINTGVYDVENRPFYKTITPSMDILVSSNLERLLFDLSGCDGARVARFMGDLAGRKRYAIDEAMKAALQKRYFAGCVDEAGIRAEIRRTWEENHYLMDTHTAVASAVLRAYQKETGDARRSVIVSTASPYKFGASVLGAVAGQAACAGLDDFACCRALAERTGTKEPEQIRALPNLPIRHTAVCEKDAMEQAVLEQIKV